MKRLSGTLLAILLAALLGMGVMAFTTASPETSAPPASDTDPAPELPEPVREPDWRLTLVNEANPLPEDYEPETAEADNGYLFDIRAVEPLRALLQPREARVPFVKGGDLVLLASERAHHARAGERLARLAQHPVLRGLLAAVEREREQQHAEHDERERRDGDDERHRLAGVDGERHDRRAQHDERRAQKQAQHEVPAGQGLVDVAGQTRDERGRADAVERRKRERLQAGERRMPQLRGKPRRRAGGIVLRRDGGHAADDGQRDQHQAHVYDLGFVDHRDTHVDDRGYDERHQQLERRLQHLEQRREHGLLSVIP